MTNPKAKPFFSVLSFAFRSTRINSAVEFAEKFVRLPGSAKSSRFDSSITPWTRAPIEDLVDPFCRISDFVKPVQCGGSVVGEIAICFWIYTATGGDVQYNWQDDENADDRWDKRLERILRGCAPVNALWPTERGKAQKGLVLFPHLNLMVQGVFTEKRVASDSIRFQVNEELHSWKPGRMEQAHRRTTAYWNSQIFNISNASVKGDQLNQSFEAGTQEHWEVKCPGCGLYHVKRTRWDDKRPDLGGLRYDADGCRREDGSYDYMKLEPTIRFQMPCGYPEREDPRERRAISLSGRYGEPRNRGAHLSHRSRTLEAVSVDYIPFLTLVQEKHQALKALKYGDPEPFKRYRQERECGFWDNSDRPFMGAIVISSGIKKNRDGWLKDPLFFNRYFALDRQQGSLAKGEFPHWWIVIRDVLTTGDSRLVYEGKALTDENAISVLDDHQCVRIRGVADSGDDTTHVYTFCLRYGIHAIKGTPEPFFTHEVPKIEPETGKTRIISVKRIYSPTRPLHLMLGAGPTRQNRLEEPQFWLYSRGGIAERLDFLRTGGAVKWEVPEDVSDDYKSHMEAQELEEQRDKRGFTQMVYVKVKDRDDLLVCERYIAMQMEMAGVIGAQAEKLPAVSLETASGDRVATNVGNSER
jgi:hypothetical protein